jgi:hypothetical protein
MKKIEGQKSRATVPLTLTFKIKFNHLFSVAPHGKPNGQSQYEPGTTRSL